MNATTKKFFSKWPAAISVCLGLVMGVAMSIASTSEVVADDSPARAPAPTIGLEYQVFLPTGSPRIYQDQDDATYWKDGLAIVQGDQIQVTADVATGAQPMTRFQARIDQLPQVTVTSAPWVVNIDTKTLGVGRHTLEVQAQLGGRNMRLAKRTTEFMLVQSLPDSPGPAASGSGVITSVEGTEQVLSKGNVTSVPLPSDTVKLPPLIASKSLDGNALISLDLGKTDNASMQAGKLIVLDQAVSAIVHPQPTSSAHRYVFSLARNGDVLYTSPTILDIDSTRIRLQPKTHDQTGLLPGVVHLYVWGIDDAGNYGPVTEATLDVRQPKPSAASE